MQTLQKKDWKRVWESLGLGLKETWDRAKAFGRSLATRRKGKNESDTEMSAVWSWDRSLGAGFWWSSPRVSVSENDKEVRVLAKLPGLSKDAFAIDIDGRLLTLRAEQSHQEEKRERGYRYSSRSYGSYLRTIPLPSEVDASTAKAKYRNGELCIRLPKTAVTQTRRIEIGG